MIEVLRAQYGLFMTVEDLAEVVKSNKQTIYNRIYRQDLGIPHWRHGQKYLFPTEGVAEYISEQLTTG